MSRARQLQGESIARPTTRSSPAGQGSNTGRDMSSIRSDASRSNGAANRAGGASRARPSHAARAGLSGAPHSKLTPNRLFGGFAAGVAALIGLAVWLRATPPAEPALSPVVRVAASALNPAPESKPPALAVSTTSPAPSSVCSQPQDDANARGDNPLMTASAEPITLHPIGAVASSAIAPAGPTDVAEETAFNFINDQRALVGLPPMGWQSALAVAARAHARYNARNGASGHDEKTGAPLFTGATPTARITAAWPTKSGAEIVADAHGQFARPQDAIEGLFDAPFHRARVLSDALCAGAGTAIDSGAAGEQSTLVVDFGGRRREFRDSELLAYPFSGQSNAKTSWRAIENPNPLTSTPDLVGRVVGYPLTLNSAPDSWLSVRAFTLTDAAGADVPCIKADLSTNPDDPDVAACVPVRPLKPYTTYSATAVGTLTRGTQVGRKFQVAWSFTTGPSAAQDSDTSAMPAEQRPSFEGPSVPGR